MPARKKDASARARANRAAGATTLTSASVIAPSRRPRIPGRLDERGKRASWHPQVLAWWRDVWASPMAGQWHSSDVHRMLVVARLIQAFWTTGSPQGMSQLAAEIRLQSAAFGLTPYDRLRLEWQFEETDAAKRSGAQARATGRAPRPSKTAAAKDPRHILHSVS